MAKDTEEQQQRGVQEDAPTQTAPQVPGGVTPVASEGEVGRKPDDENGIDTTRPSVAPSTPPRDSNVPKSANNENEFGSADVVYEGERSSASVRRNWAKLALSAVGVVTGVIAAWGAGIAFTAGTGGAGPIALGVLLAVGSIGNSLMPIKKLSDHYAAVENRKQVEGDSKEVGRVVQEANAKIQQAKDINRQKARELDGLQHSTAHLRVGLNGKVSKVSPDRLTSKVAARQLPQQSKPRTGRTP